MRDAIARLLERMEQDLARLREAGDARRFFHATYLRTTRAIGEEIDRGGFIDGDWMERWDIAFAEFYLDALDADRRGDPVAGPWRVAFDTARDRTDLPPLRHVLFGINAHINFDLPQALLAVVAPEEFDDPRVRARREADHGHVDSVLVTRVGAEDAELAATTPPSWLDRLLRPLNQAATKRFLAEARAKVWRNTDALDRARRGSGEEYRRRLGELEALCAARVADLARPGLVLLRLARGGFGVTLDPRA